MIRKSPPTLVQQRHAWHCIELFRNDGVPIIRAFIDYAAIIIQALIGDISKDTKDASRVSPWCEFSGNAARHGPVTRDTDTV